MVIIIILSITKILNNNIFKAFIIYFPMIAKVRLVSTLKGLWISALKFQLRAFWKFSEIIILIILKKNRRINKKLYVTIFFKNVCLFYFRNWQVGWNKSKSSRRLISSQRLVFSGVKNETNKENESGLRRWSTLDIRGWLEIGHIFIHSWHSLD